MAVPLPKDPNPNWMGYSVGRWEGDTFVVESSGFNDNVWLDNNGHPAGEALRVTERFRRKNFGSMDIEITIDDPKTYTKPWNVTLPLVFQPDTEMLDTSARRTKRTTIAWSKVRPRAARSGCQNSRFALRPGLALAPQQSRNGGRKPDTKYRWHNMLRHLIACCGLVTLAVGSCIQPVDTQANRTTPVVLYEGARLIAGDGSAPIADSAFLVENGTITRVGRKGDVTAPRGAGRINLTGKTVMPTLINAHGHPGFQRGLTYSADNFTRENIVDDLNRALYFGVAVVQSQGIEKGDVMYQIRADQEAGKLGGARLHIAGRGIGAPNAGPGGAAYAGIAYEVTTEDQARKAVQEVAARKVNLVKIWVDDRNGRAPRLSPDLFRAVIDEGHKHGLQVNAHVFYHTDAVDLVNAGIDALVHLVRDKEMDDALVASVVQHNVYVQPNLSPEWTTYTDLPHWLQDGDPLMKLLQESASAPVIARMKRTFGNRDPAAVERTRTQYAILQRSLAKLARANAKITLGLRHRPRRSSVRHGGAARAGKHGQGRHDADAGHRRRDEPAGRVPQARQDGHAGPGNGRRFPGARRESARRHHEHAADFEDLHEGRRSRPGLAAAVTDQGVHELRAPKGCRRAVRTLERFGQRIGRTSARLRSQTRAQRSAA